MKIPSKEVLTNLLDYDPETGIFKWKVRTAYRVQKGDQAGCLNDRGYRRIEINYQAFAAHRLAWMIVYGEQPDEIDHVNGNRDDNRISNLRSVSHSKNMQNTILPKRNTSGAIGVSWYEPRNKWRVQTSINGKKKHLGYFSNIEDAIKCKKDADKKYGYHENHGRVLA